MIQQRWLHVRNWHDWFAWYPYFITDGRLVWLRTIEVRVDDNAADGWYPLTKWESRIKEVKHRA